MIAALAVVAALSTGQVRLLDEGADAGTILTINCSGTGVTCTRTGSVGTVAVASTGSLPSNGANCGTGLYARGVDENGVAEGCTADQGVGTLVLADADTNNATTAYANIIGLSWSAAANTRYEFQCYLMYQSTATTTGVMFAVNGPSGATVDYRLEIQTAANPGAGAMSTVTQPWTHGVTLDEATAATAGVAATGTNYYAVLVGTLRTGETSGTMAIRHKSETATTTTVKAGSWCVYY